MHFYDKPNIRFVSSSRGYVGILTMRNGRNFDTLFSRTDLGNIREGNICPGREILWSVAKQVDCQLARKLNKIFRAT